MIAVLSALYVVALGGMSVFGLLGLITLGLYWRYRSQGVVLPQGSEAFLPFVTVQLPVFNERYVVEKLIETAVALDYPRDRLQIQVIDDSTDDTTAKAASLVAHYQQQGVNICHIRRQGRQGYKAGALAQGLETAVGEFIAIFDADFQPGSNFLRVTIPHFYQNPRLGLVQTRWGHLNAKQTLLTRAQAIAMDKHFVMEQGVRFRANLFPKFNGTAGVWRRSCLEDAGGWLYDTVCEDLCLSTRAVLRQWEFRYLAEVESPAELPMSITAYKNQQARWAKGSTQCLLKYGRAIVSAHQQSHLARLYALLATSAYTTNIFVLLLLLVQVPLVYLNYRFPPEFLLFAIAGIGQPLLFLLAQQILYRDWSRRILFFPALMAVAVGLSASNSRAILQALFARQHPFVRTVKTGALRLPHSLATYRFSFDPIILVELGMALYTAVGLWAAVHHHNFGPLFLLATAVIGFSYVSLNSLREWLTT